jgi:lysozyme family protein
MSTFETAWPIILRHEGGYCNNANDLGGPTKYGLSLRWLKAQGYFPSDTDLRVEIKEIQALTLDQAEGFYRVKWWDYYGYGQIAAQVLATKIFDMAVNLGAPRAHRLAETALGLRADGILGAVSIAGLNAQQGSPLPLLCRIQNLQAAFYDGLVAANPKLTCFLEGWINRAYDKN